MKILSLFDGISCGYVALKKAGIDIEKYYASEVDKYAISISKKNHSDIVHLGDVNNWKDWDIDFSDIDLIIGGSPCQGFTFAGKRLNFDDERSKLFFVYADIIKTAMEVNPNIKFLLENVKMKKEHMDVITEYLFGIKPILINSNQFSAQNRQRYYWFNWEINKPFEENTQVIKDIIDIEANNDVKTFVSKIHHNAWLKSYPEWSDNDINLKSRPLLATYFKQPPHCPYIIYRAIDEINEEENKYSIYRRLSPKECERLQNLPDNYTEYGVDGKEISYTQRWKSTGNGWTVNVLVYIFSHLT